MRVAKSNLAILAVTVALVLLLGRSRSAHAEVPITFVLPVVNYEPIPVESFTDETAASQDEILPLTPPPVPERPITPPQSAPLPPGAIEVTQEYAPMPIYETEEPPVYGACESESGETESPWAPPGRMPNGQYPDNWLDRCGGSAYRTGPGMCDNWKVGCRWETSVDGMMLFREDANLDALWDATDTTSIGTPQGLPEVFDQFDYAPGGRVSFTGHYPECAGYIVQAVYEGVEEWNASIVNPKITPYPTTTPPAPSDSSEQRSVFYRSSLHSGELNVAKQVGGVWRPFCGIRYVKFDDEINDTINQEVQPPLPANPPIIVQETDRSMITDLENNLIGFQIGTGHDLWHPSRRCTLEGFVNAGVYYNRIKRTQLMSVTTTQFIGEDTLNPDIGRTDTVTASNLSISEPSEMATIAEASLTCCFKLNRCWSTRVGYQVLWIDGISLAEDSFLNTGIDTRDLFFHGCHAGIECRR